MAGYRQQRQRFAYSVKTKSRAFAPRVWHTWHNVFPIFGSLVAGL